MKKINYILIFLLIIPFSSCKKTLDSEGVSKTTYYPIFTVTGDAVVLAPVGTPFTDPGVVAKAGGTEIPVTTTVTGVFSPYHGSTVDANTPNEYAITYSAINKDGFAGTTTRTVYVAKTGDLVSSIEGLYKSTVVRNGATGAQYTNMKYVMIWKTGAKTYTISDGIGGYYAIGRNYGPGYFASGVVITANDIPTNNFTFGPAVGVGAFGGALTLTSLIVDPAAKTIVIKSAWDAGYNFVITLTQVQI